MEARCYHGGEGRTKLHPLTYQKRDFLAYAVLLLYFGGMIAMAAVLP